MVPQHRFEAGRGAGLLGEQAGVAQQHPVFEGHAAAQARRGQPHEGVKILRRVALLRRAEVEPDVVLLADAVEERDEAVVEDVEEVAEGGDALAVRVAVGLLLQQGLGIGLGERPQVAGQPHEVDPHRHGWAADAVPRPGPRDAADVGGGEGEVGQGGEAHGLAVRLGGLAQPRRLGKHLFDQAHRLEEVEAVALLEQPVPYSTF